MIKLKEIAVFLLLTLCSHNVFATSCIISGCNNEICGRAGESYFSTCMWKAEYACYNKFGICEADKSGECGWRQTSKLVECVKIQIDRVQKGDLSSD